MQNFPFNDFVICGRGVLLGYRSGLSFVFFSRSRNNGVHSRFIRNLDCKFAVQVAYNPCCAQLNKMIILSKINKAKYIEDMFENEYLYFSSLKEFRSSSKDESGRLDPKELNLKNEQLTTLTIILEDKEIELHKMKEFNGQYMEHLSDPKINCCSLHWLEIEQGHPPSTLNDKLIEMGDKTLLIYNWKKFFEIIDDSIENLGFEYSRRKVDYYNPKQFNGEITLHHKDEEYSWQNEFRILISPTDNQPIKIPVNGLKKLSCIINTQDLKNLRIKIEN